jgi:signal transduction histidine kinase/CHASE3 domain sensor protein
MTRRLTVRTLTVSALIVVIVAGVLGGLTLAIDSQHDAGERARRSQAVISAANLTQQRLLAVQTAVRGFLIRGNETLLSDYRSARAAFPAAALELQALVERDPAQRRLAAQIQQQATAYVDSYADPVIARTRETGVSAGRAFATANDGTARAGELTGLIGQLGAAEQAMSERRASDADTATQRALLIAALGLLLCMLALGLATAFVARRIVMPVGRLAAAAERVRRGELDVVVPERSGDEVGRLGSAFNAMARSLEQSRAELESQNTELEMQAIALEERQEELTEAGDETRAQRDQLEHAAAQLASEKARAERYGEFADRLARTRDPAVLAQIALSTLADAAGADVGVLYTSNWRDETRWGRAAVLALDPSPLAEHAIAGGEGASARAVASGSVVLVDSDAAGLRVRTGLGGEATVVWELHVPLRHGSHSVGVATLGGVSSAAFDAATSPTLSRLAGQAAVALAEAGALAQRNWFSQVNTAVLDCVREGIALVGLDHELVLANAAMERLAERLAMPIPAAIGASGALNGDSSVASDPEAYFARWEVMLADTEEPIADELTVSGMVLERYTAPVDDETGARIGRLVVLRDVTREREVDQLKSDLMATVSHELRTPLASVLGYAELLRTRELSAPARDEMLGTVHREAKRLSALIDDFLDVQAIEQDRLLLSREPFSVGDLLAEQVRTFSGQSQKHRLTLTPCEEPVVAFGDRARIAQVIANLLSNAIKYSPDGGLVAVSASCTSGFVLVAVTDEGLGIPLSEQEHVFEKFFRVERSAAQRLGGTGLGLALAHEIVVAHGGRMGFESTEGAGSRFWFTLPTE